jgi:nucleosome binding factor SPN SPT16 subunit
MATGLDELLVVELADEDVLVVVDDAGEFVVVLLQEISIIDVRRRQQTINKYNLLFIFFLCLLFSSINIMLGE